MALADRRAQLRQLEVRKRVASRALTSNANLEADRAIALGEKARDIVDLMDQLRVSGNVREELAQLPGPVLRPPRHELGRAHVCTPVNNEQLVCRLLLEKK